MARGGGGGGGGGLTPLWGGCGRRKCGLGCPLLDSFLQGGIPCGSITELVGEAGSAKTQLCLQLLLAAQLPPSHNGLLASSLYIYTEGYFPSRRLQQLADAFIAAGKFNHTLRLPASDSTRSSPLHSLPDNPCDNVFVQAIQSIDELFDFLQQAHDLLSRPLSMPVKLLVIDSIAALFRSDFDNTSADLVKRTNWFFKVSSRLKLYAHKFDLAVVVTNQVVDHVETQALRSSNSVNEMLSGSPQPLVSSGRRVVPALGLAWSHCVNMRLFMSRVVDLHWRPDTLNLQHSMSSCPAKEVSVKCLPDGLGRGNCPQPRFSVLEHLESELPDALLLRLSPWKAAEEASICGSCHIDQVSESACLSLLTKHEERRQVNFAKEPSYISNSAADPASHSRIVLRRTLHIVFAPHLPASCCEFVVETNQVRGIAAVPRVRTVAVGDE